MSATAHRFGDSILARAELLATITEDVPRVTRAYLTPEHRRAGERIAGWMREAGMSVHWDALGNVVGRYHGATLEAKYLLTGSHYDTVRNGGKYDGRLGILTAIACVHMLQHRTCCSGEAADRAALHRRALAGRIGNATSTVANRCSALHHGALRCNVVCCAATWCSALRAPVR